MWVNLREFVQVNTEKLKIKLKNKNAVLNNFIVSIFPKTKPDSYKITCDEVKAPLNVKYKQSIFLIVAFQFIIMYLEVAFHLMIFKSVKNIIFIPIIFAIPSGMLIGWILNLFNWKIKKALAWLITSILCLIYCVQLVYYHVFKAFFSIFSIAGVGTDVLEFFDQIISAIGKNVIGLIILLVPIIVIWYLFKIDLLANKEESVISNKESLKNEKRRANINQIIISGGLIILFHLISVLLLSLYGRDTYSPFDLYHNTWIQEMSMEQLGVLTSTRFDVTRLIINKDAQVLQAGINLSSESEEVKNQQKSEMKEENLDTKNNNKIEDNSTTNPTSSSATTPAPTSSTIDTTPNVLNIDFASLTKEETNEKIKNMHQYFETIVPTNKNKYTGMFKGYNLILITAEGFSPYAVNPKITPTLYRLTHEGFVFQNFYTPLWWASTSDGEYVACTSLIPKAGVTSFYLSGSNAMPFALGNQFRELGYVTKAYHNHTYTYYKRHISHPNMGYEYKGVGNGLVVKETWPESDLEMMEVTIPEYINNQPFHTYYMTVSGHMNYTFMGNSMAAKNKTVVENLPYSMEAKAYLACNVELDRALEKLIEELENKGIADKTVIALSADHYPYGLEKDKIDELAGHEVETNFELYRNHFILWTESMEEPITIEKACSSLDIVPTLFNLFGIPYDSRLFMGSDILSDTGPLVIFSNRSFITDKVMYNNKTKKVTKLTENTLPDNYISTINKIINNKFIVSEEILEEDYYSYIIPFLSNK